MKVTLAWLILLFLGTSVSSVSLGFGEICIPSEDAVEKCDTTQFLACLEIFVAEFRCFCDPKISEENENPSESSKPCRCKEDEYFEVGGMCIKYTEDLNGTCTYPNQCKFNGTICNSGKCECNPFTHFLNSAGTTCVLLPSRLNDTCGITEHCAPLGAGVVCNDQGICTCSNGYFYSDDGKTCLKYADSVGGPCAESPSKQCANVDGAQCPYSEAGYMCTCIDSYVKNPFDLSKCLPKVSRLQYLCTMYTIPEHCSLLRGAFCSNGTCQCKELEGWDAPLYSQTDCFKAAVLVEEPCERDFNCRNIPFTSCSIFSHSCICGEGTVPSGDRTRCNPIVWKLGEPCSASTECEQGIGDNSKCSNFKCVCKSGFIEVIGGTKDRCLEKSSVGDLCSVKEQCLDVLGMDADCVEGKCGCRADFVLVGNDHCVRRAGLNSPCNTTEECVLGSNGNAACEPILGLCKCVNGTIEVEGSCRAPIGGGIGDSCSEHGDCQKYIRGPVLCAEGRCRCSFGTSPAYNDNYTCGAMRVFGSFYGLAFLGIVLLGMVESA